VEAALFPVPQQYPPVPAHRNAVEEDNAHKVSMFLVSNRGGIWRVAGGQKQEPGCPGIAGNQGKLKHCCSAHASSDQQLNYRFMEKFMSLIFHYTSSNTAMCRLRYACDAGRANH